MKKLIINSDDFGISKEVNCAILKGYQNGIITSTCIIANGKDYDHGIKEILPLIPNIGKGIHLNALEGKSLTKPSLLTDEDGIFNKNFVYLLYNQNNKKLLKELENEFRAQIEKILSDVKIDHINSHIHIHAIPTIFNLTIKLALEYGIKNVRLQYEKPYFTPLANKFFNKKYFVNLIKLALLNFLSKINKKTIERLNYNLENKKIFLNDYIIGVGYTGLMDEDTILCGLSAINSVDKITEIIIHPKDTENKLYLSNKKEFLASLNPELKDKIFNLGYELTNYNN